MKNHQKSGVRLAAFIAAASAIFAPAQLVNQGGTITIQNNAKLVSEGTIGGVADIAWPVQEPYGTALDDATVCTQDGEVIEVGIVIPPMTMTCVPGPQGPTYHSGADTPTATAIPAYIKFVRQSREAVFVPVQMLLEVQNTEAAPSGSDFQVIDTEIVSMSLTMEQGNHPYFSSVSCVVQPGGSGRTTLRRIEGGDFWADSFFDISFDLSMVGAPGELFDGVVIQDQASVRLRQTLDVFDGVTVSPIGAATLTDDGTCLNIDNLGSSGSDGVSFYYGSKKGYDHYVASSSTRLQAPVGGGGLLANGEAMSMFPHPPPPKPDFPDLPELPAREIACTNTNGVVSVVCSSNAVRASEWTVEVWEGDVLKAVGTAPDESTCWSVPAQGFRPVGIRCAGATERGGKAMMTTVVLEVPVEVTIAGSATPVTGNCITVSPRDPQLLLGGVDRLDIVCSSDHLCVESVTLGDVGVNYQGLDNAVLSSGGRGRLKVSNLGSSGCDGVSISNGGSDTLDNDCDGICLPLSTSFEPVDVQGREASVWVSSVDVNGDNVATAEYRGGGGAGGAIWVDYNTASTVCRVSVLNQGVFVGEVDVPLIAGTETEVCAIGTDGEGNAPQLTGCGKLRLEWPWELSCLVEEFDRPVSITPVGGSPLVGDEVRLLAPGATAAEVESIHSIQIRTSGIPEIILSGTTTGPFLPAPVLPPSSTTEWEFPGVGFELVQESNSYYTWDPASGSAVCANKKVRDWQLVSQNGNRRTYSATMDLHLEGVGGLVYSRDLELPGSFTIQLGNHPFVGQDVQQYEVQLLDYSFVLPQGDPDIRALRVTSGSNNGFSGGGDVVTRKIPECELEIQAILEILEEFVLQGQQGGPLSGGGIQTAAHETVHVVQQNSGISGGMAFTPIGQAAATSQNDQLTISNLGSSGEDGVSIELPDAESCTVRFSDAAPVDLAPGGVFSFAPRGLSPGAIAGIAVGTCVVTHSGGTNPFLDISAEFAPLSPTGTTIEVYDAGQLVAQMPGGPTSATLQAYPFGGLFSPIQGCGKLSGRSSTPCDFIRFRDRVIFRVSGQPDVTGDEVRLLAQGVQVGSLSTMELTFGNTSGDVVIAETAFGVSGREIVMGGGSRATDHNSSRSNKTSSIAFDPNPDDDDNDGIDGFIEMRAPRSVFLPGQQQLWPLSCVIDSATPVLSGVGASLKFEAFGTINGKARSSYGVLEACTASDGTFLLKGDFSSRGNAEVCLRVRKRIDQSSPLLAQGIVSTGGTYAEIRPLSGGGRFPLNRVSAVPELYEPPFDEVECSYMLNFGELVEVTLPGQAPVIASEIEVQLVAPTFVSEDIHCLRISGHEVEPLVIEGIGTGPFYGQGLVNTTLGGAQIEEQTPGDRGSLVVSNIGSSGQDGVRIDLGEGQGVWQNIAPMTLANQGSILGLSVEPCLGTPEECAELPKLQLRASDNPLFQSNELNGEMPDAFDSLTVVGTSIGEFGGAVSVSGDGSWGSIAAQGGGTGSIIGYGLLPPTVIDGYGLVPTSLVIQYDQPMVFTPEGVGAPFVFDTLRCEVVGLPDQLEQKRLLGLDVQLAGLPQMEIENTQLIHLNRVPLQSLGVAELIPLDGSLTIDNLGSSGMDGVRVNSGIQTGWAIEVEGDFVTGSSLTTSAVGTVEGVQGISIGETTIRGGVNGNLTIEVDYSPLNVTEVKVCVLSGEDGGLCGESNHFLMNGDIPVIGSVSASAPIGFGYAQGRLIPGGGVQPGGFYWDFAEPVEVLPPGVSPGNGLFGSRILVLPGGGSVPTEIVSLSLRTQGVSSVRGVRPKVCGECRPSASLDSFFDVWLELNFSAAEIAQLATTDYNLDFDGDGFSELQEFILGFGPKVPDSPERGVGFSTANVEGPTGEMQKHFRMSFEFDPSKQGVYHELGISTTLDDWSDIRVAPDMIVAPDMWRLIEIEELPDGNQRNTYERTDAIGSSYATEFYRHHGHVTILK